MVQTYFFFRMPVTWREREHALVDDEVMNDPNALETLRGCGFLKFFKMPNMKENTRWLEMLIHYWSIEDDSFMIDQMPLKLEIEDVYLITSRSWRGEVVHSTGRS